MGKKKYVFDSDDFSVGRDGRKGRRFAMLVLKLFLASISLTVIYYIVFALFFSTDTERALRNENRMLERMYPEMERKIGETLQYIDQSEERIEGVRVHYPGEGMRRERDESRKRGVYADASVWARIQAL